MLINVLNNSTYSVSIELLKMIDKWLIVKSEGVYTISFNMSASFFEIVQIIRISSS